MGEAFEHIWNHLEGTWKWVSIDGRELLPDQISYFIFSGNRYRRTRDPDGDGEFHLYVINSETIITFYNFNGTGPAYTERVGVRVDGDTFFLGQLEHVRIR